MSKRTFQPNNRRRAKEARFPCSACEPAPAARSCPRAVAPRVAPSCRPESAAGARAAESTDPGPRITARPCVAAGGVQVRTETHTVTSTKVSSGAEPVRALRLHRAARQVGSAPSSATLVRRRLKAVCAAANLLVGASRHPTSWCARFQTAAAGRSSPTLRDEVTECLSQRGLRRDERAAGLCTRRGAPRRIRSSTALCRCCRAMRCSACCTDTGRRSRRTYGDVCKYYPVVLRVCGGFAVQQHGVGRRRRHWRQPDDSPGATRGRSRRNRRCARRISVTSDTVVTPIRFRRSRRPQGKD